MATIQFKISSLPLTIKRNGMDYLVTFDNGIHGSYAYIYSDDPELNGAGSANFGYKYGWISAFVDEGDKYVRFYDVPSRLVSPKTKERTAKHLKRLCDIFSRSTSGKDEYDMREMREHLRLTENISVQCEISGREIPTKYAIKTVTSYAAKTYLHKMTLCARSCKPFIAKEGNHIMTDSGIVHILYKDHYKKCRNCGIYHSRMRPLCNYCLLEYWVCDHCNEVIPLDDEPFNVGGKRICKTCKQDYNYSKCECCGDTFILPKGYLACDSCSRPAIKSYSTKHPARESYRNMMYGVEMEVCVERADDDTKPTNSQVAHMLYKQISDCAIIKSDSSINYGFEIVTEPLVYSECISECKRILNLASTLRCRADSSCGVHIHVSREHLSQRAIANLIFMLSEMEDDIIKVAGRYSDEWAKITKKTASECDDEYDVCESTRNSGRYQALNLCNSKTAEFRIFSSTTSENTIAAYIQFVHMMVDYASNNKLSEIEGKTLKDVFSGRESLYPELNQYLKQVNVI